MSSYTDLPRKPLVEAILEIRWELDGNKDPAYPLYAGVLAGALTERFPVHERLAAADIPDEMTPRVVKLRFRAAENGWPVVQAGPGIATLNFVQEYTWDTFKSEAELLWDHLDSSYATVNSRRSPKISSLQLRYLNATPLLGVDPQEFLGQKLHIPFSLPNDVVSATNRPASDLAIVIRSELNLPGTIGTIGIQTAKQDGRDVMTLDLIAEGSMDPPVDKRRFVEWLDAAHSTLEQWFFALVAGDLLAEFSVEDKQ